MKVAELKFKVANQEVEMRDMDLAPEELFKILELMRIMNTPPQTPPPSVAPTKKE